ncbi:MAG: DUF4352 domain-containing protein [Oscillospiraceae bacterium]|nr:DUF4352 domain-containing protein [Oscillospiraceae bacterium]
MSKKLISCKACGAEIASSAKSCPHCGAKNKKPIFKKWWFWAIILVILIASCSAGGNDGSEESPATITNQVQTVNTAESINTTETETEAIPEADTQTVYHVGDILQDGDLKIVYMSSGEYKEESAYLQPDAGYKYIFLQFAFENTSDHGDESVSSFDFEGYADGYAVEQYYGGDEDLSATLSAGRSTTGYIYFTVPENAAEIDIEYETNYFTEEKIHFIYEGEQSCDYVPQATTSATEGAYAVGDVINLGDLQISYLSCYEYVDYDSFYQPRDGFHFMTCEFEFENKGKSDEYISSYDFDCYADGANCELCYARDDELSATLSAGRKTKGTVTFEVPVDAAIVEAEYLNNVWTSDRIVFTIK